MTSNIQTEKVLKITGSDNVTFLDSIISNNIEVDSIKPSFLLGPDGKINHWFFLCFLSFININLSFFEFFN